MNINSNYTIRLGNRNIVKIMKGSTVIWEKSTTPVVTPDYFYVENTYNGTNTVSVKQTITGSPDSSTYVKHLQYSKDGLNWTTITLSSTEYTISLSNNEKVYFRGNEGVFNYSSSDGSQKAITTISASQNHTVGGNINSLLDYTDPNGLTLPQGAFNNMFNGDTHLTSASDITLPATTLATYCYNGMFRGCTALTTTPNLPATTLDYGCYGSMFRDCTALTSTPNLPATTLAQDCYGYMFNNCTALTTTPNLPATTLASRCYSSMFQNCTALTSAPTLPATTLAEYCYYNMFNGCSSLTTAPNLPATTLATSCYQSMFYGASSLVNVPAELPAINLAEACYRNMFRDCTSLTASPVIKAKTFATNSCFTMFSGCTLLNSMTVYANDKSATDCTKRWLANVASSGTFTNYGSATYTINSASGIPQGWTEVKPSPQVDYLYVQNTSSGTNNITLTKDDTSANTKTLEYSKDLSNWTSFTPTDSTFTITLNQGEKLYLRGSNGTRPNLTIWGQANHITGGNVNTLLDYTNPNGVSLPQNAFKSLFNGDLYLTDASNLVLPATTLANNCYSYMFYICTALTATPKLPATTLAQNCYYNMFAECTSLTTAPVLPATTLAEGCYYFMFYHCTSLTTAPTLPAPTLVSQCYQQMFSKCTSLNSVTTYAEDISATDCLLEWLFNVASSGTLHNLGRAPYPTNSRSGIPDGWTEDKPLDFFYIKNVDSQSGNVSFVFNGSTSYNTLKKIEYSKDRLNWTSVNVSSTETTIPTNVGEKVYFRNNNGYCNNQFSYIHFNSDINVNVGGNLYTLLNYNNVNVSIQSDYVFNYLFVSMIKLLDASKLVLPWTTLRNRCYNGMFGGCSSLITPPELPATTLVQYCYSGMFQNCSSLTSITTYAEDISADSCLFGWVGNVNTVGTFYNNGSATYTTGSDGIPSRWTEVKPSTGPDYFYIENTDDTSGNVSFTFNGAPGSDTIQQIEWSKDKTNWTTVILAADTTTDVPIDVGEKVYFRNDNGKCSMSSSEYLSFNSDIYTNTGGELYTLLDYTDENVSLRNYAFSSLFEGNSYLIDASNLVLRWTTLTQYCYRRMFSGCRALEIPPSLITTTLARYCYKEMFYRCSSLQIVITYADDISASGCLRDWLKEVAPAGIFCNLGSATYPTGTSGIPNGWSEETEPPY